MADRGPCLPSASGSVCGLTRHRAQRGWRGRGCCPGRGSSTWRVPFPGPRGETICPSEVGAGGVGCQQRACSHLAATGSVTLTCVPPTPCHTSAVSVCLHSARGLHPESCCVWRPRSGQFRPSGESQQRTAVPFVTAGPQGLCAVMQGPAGQGVRATHIRPQEHCRRGWPRPSHGPGGQRASSLW